MAIQGLRDTSNFVSGQRPENWREGILLRYPNGKMPLLALTSLMKKRVVDDYTFNWWEKSLDDRRFDLHATSGDLTVSNTAITLAAGNNAKTLKQGDLLWVEATREILRVTADPTSDTAINVSRGFAGTTPATLDANGAGINPNLLYIGSAYEEGSLAPTGIAYDPTKYTNLTQIFRDTLEATRTAIKTRLRTGDAVKEAKRECLEYHGIGIERSMWLGQQVDTTFNGKPLHTMRGFEPWMVANASGNVVTATAAGVDLDELESYFYNIFKFGSSEKLGIVGNRALLTINQIVRKNTQYQVFAKEKEYGMNVVRLITPFGEIVLKSHPLWNQIYGGTTGGTAYFGMEAWMAVLDMENFTYVNLKDSDTQYQPDLQSNGLDGMQSGYLSECSLEIHHAPTHYLIKGLGVGIADS